MVSEQILLNVSDVIRITHLPRSSIYQMIAAGDFPRPVRVGKGRSRWRLEDIQRWARELQPA